MPLEPIAEDGEVTFTNPREELIDIETGRTSVGPHERRFESTGDAAMDAILLRCHLIEMKLEHLAADIAKLPRVGFLVDMLPWLLAGAVAGLVMGLMR